MAARPWHTPSLRAPAQPALPLTASRCRKPFRSADVVWRRFRPSPKPEWTRASVPPPSRSLQNGVLDERGHLPEASAKAAPIDASCHGTSKVQTAYVREHSNEREVDLDGYSSRLGLSVSGLRRGAPFQRLLENQDPMRRVRRGQHCLSVRRLSSISHHLFCRAPDRAAIHLGRLDLCPRTLGRERNLASTDHGYVPRAVARHERCNRGTLLGHGPDPARPSKECLNRDSSSSARLPRLMSPGK